MSVPCPKSFVLSDLRSIGWLSRTGGYWFHVLLVSNAREIFLQEKFEPIEYDNFGSLLMKLT